MEQAGQHGYTPEEVALLARIRIFVTMRWCVVVGTVVATLIASRLFHIGFPTLPVYIICGIIAAYNIILFFQVRNLAASNQKSIVQKTRHIGNIHFFLDLISLTGILHFTGGVENPFIFYFVAHVISASVVLHYRMAFLLSTAAVVIVGLLVGLEYFAILPHVNLQGFASTSLYQEKSYITAVMTVLTTLIYGFTYMLTAISGELRKRQRQVVQLQNWFLEQKTYELNRASREIGKLEEEKRRFLYFLGIAAHDLKAPLTAIQGYLWVMLGGYAGDLNDKQRGMIERSSFRIKELLNLISNLLDIPRIETGQILQEMKEISMTPIIVSAVEDLRNLADEKGLKIELDLEENLPTIKGAESRLKQVMINLIDNSIRYTSQGSIKVHCFSRERLINVEVTDTGVGIPQDEQPRLFQDFFRGSNVEAKGTGLGLSIVKRLVEAHGGNIKVESPCSLTGCGTRFSICLPAT
jgi:signal transduction histidine kinase